MIMHLALIVLALGASAHDGRDGQRVVDDDLELVQVKLNATDLSGQTPVAAIGTPTGYESRDEIPSGCVLTNKLKDGARCIFSDQCQSKHCCPFFKACDPIGQATSEDEKLKTITRGQSCTKESGSCDVCAFRELANNPDAKYHDTSTNKEFQCSDNGGPDLKGTKTAEWFGPWDLRNSACKCSIQFLEWMMDGSWVPACQTGDNNKAKPTPHPTPPTALAGYSVISGTGEARCVDKSTQAAVRCCSDEQRRGWKNCGETWVSGFWRNCNTVTYGAVADICQYAMRNRKGRLCELEELQKCNSTYSDTDCGQSIWTGTSCQANPTLT